MTTHSTFTGRFLYYENIDGKVKTVEKTFTDPKKFSAFIRKYSVDSFFGLESAGDEPKKSRWAKFALSRAKHPKN